MDIRLFVYTCIIAWHVERLAMDMSQTESTCSDSEQFLHNQNQMTEHVGFNQHNKASVQR